MRWFSLARREEAALNRLEEHLRLVGKTVELFKEALESLKSYDWLSLENRYEEMNLLETEADEVQRELAVEICEGAFFGGIREDLLNLIEKVDNIADSAKDAIKALIQLPFKKELVKRLFEFRDLLDFADSCVKAVSALKDAINGLRVDKKTALELVNKVEEWEEKADSYKMKTLNRVLRNTKNSEILEIIQFQNFINIADGIADNAEDASDTLIILIAKGYG